MIPVIPPEVIDHIFSYLKGDVYTLKKCANLQHDISEIAERHLYAELVIDDGGSHDSGSRMLVELLSHKPHIANYIRHLRIRGCKDLLVEGRPVRFLDVEAFPMLRDKLPRLQSIHLVPIDRRKSTPWSAIDENVGMTILSLFCQPTIREASIQDIVGFPLAALDGCQNIRRMCLHGKLYYANPEGRPACHQLDFLFLERHQASLIPWIESHPPRVLEINVNKQDATILQKVIEITSKTVSELRIKIDEFYSDFHSKYDVVQRVVVSPNNLTFNLGSLSGLQHLHITTAMHTISSPIRPPRSDMYSTQFLFSPLWAIGQALLTLPSSCHINMATIHTLIRHIHNQDLYAVHWSTLFPSASLFKRVRQVHLHIKAMDCGGKVVPPNEMISILSADVKLVRMVEKHLVVVRIEAKDKSLHTWIK